MWVVEQMTSTKTASRAHDHAVMDQKTMWKCRKLDGKETPIAGKGSIEEIDEAFSDEGLSMM